MKGWIWVREAAARSCYEAALIPLLALAAILSMATAAHAVLLAEDHFLTSATPTGPEYSAAAISGQNPSISGFSGAWFPSVGTSPTVNATSLNYTDPLYPAETGGRLFSPVTDSRIHRLLGATNPFEPTDSGAVYMSFLLLTGTNNGYRAFEMHNGGNADAANRTLQIGLSSFGDFPNTNAFGFRINNNGAALQLGAEDGNVHLFLVKFNLSTTNNADSITVWNNPSLASLIVDPAGGVTATGFNFAADRLGVGHFTGTAYGFDEFHIGTTLADALTSKLSCDINGNGVCNSSDAAIISAHMYLPGTYANGDIDGSGTIDFVDYRLFKDHPSRVVGFDAPGSGSNTIPEPGSLLFMGFAGVCYYGLCAQRRRRRRPCRIALGVVILAFFVLVTNQAQRAEAAAQDLLNDTITFSGATLNLRPYATLPNGFNNIIDMTHRPNDTRMYVATEQGSIFVINESASGSTTPSLFFNAASALQTATGRTINFSGSQQGLQSVAFHPDFDNVGQPGYGKLYTTMLENRPTNPNSPSFFYLGNSTYGGGGADGVLAEWTYNHETGQVNPNSYRELFRTNMPVYDHPIKLAQFNPYSAPGDEDYGLLYMTHGDSNSQDSLNDDPQDRGDVLGKMLRINPLQSGADRYTIPTSNPFYNNSSPSPTGTAILGEVYAYGFRNPHNYSFNPDGQGHVRILVGDIGRSNVEEINLVAPGGNFGWTKREGTFVHKQTHVTVSDPNNPPPNADAGYILGVGPLPANEVAVGVGPDGKRYIYPVAEYDHNGTDTYIGEDYTATSVASSFRLHNGSDPALDNQFIFLNFAFNHGDVYQTDFNSMLGAVTQLNPADPSRDEPSELTQAVKYRLHLTLDGDNNPNTPPTTSDNINTLLGVFRNDSRFGEGLSGEMYISNKNNGGVYLVTNTVPQNRLTLMVDRGTGAMTITNSTGADISINRVSVFSPSGSLTPAALQSLGGDWSTSTANTVRALTQSDAVGALNVSGTTSVSLGNAYQAVLTGFDKPAGEDLQFLVTTDGPNGRNFIGNVVYTGVSTIPNTIVLTVDIVSGKASMLNQTPYSQQVEGYTIASPAGALKSAGWNSLDAQGVDDGDWRASPPLATRFTEFQENGTTTFDKLTPYELGNILQSGAAHDLAFQFLLAGEGSLRQGMVVYVLAGDYNGDHVVDAADYTVWRDNLGSTQSLPNDMTPGQVTMDDYNVWKANFGAILAGSGGGANGRSLASAPEPTSILLLIGAAISLLANRDSCAKRRP